VTAAKLLFARMLRVSARKYDTQRVVHRRFAA
jgi:hypothetical protein